MEKVYDPKNEEDDMVEMEEERLRMREHVMNEVCFKSLIHVIVLLWIIQVVAINLITKWKTNTQNRYLIGL